jgi:hypothetical protein
VSLIKLTALIQRDVKKYPSFHGDKLFVPSLGAGGWMARRFTGGRELFQQIKILLSAVLKSTDCRTPVTCCTFKAFWGKKTNLMCHS